MMKFIRCIGAIAVACLTVGSVEAQAYCALRVPEVTIQKFFPGCNHRVTTKTIDNAVRLEVGRRLPFNLHFNELGRHSVYFITDPAKSDSFQGLVHVRSEPGDAGLNEIAWALDEDLRVIDFRFQRFRGKTGYLQSIESASVRDLIIGAGYDDLRALLSRSGGSLAGDVGPFAPEVKELVKQIIHCGLKTIITTEEAWSADLWDVRVKSALGKGSWGLQSYSSGRIYSTPSMRAAEESGSPDVDAANLQGWKAVDPSTETVRYVVRTPLRISGMSRQILWILDGDGRLVTVWQQGGWWDSDVRGSFECFVGSLAKDVEDCATASELYFNEVSQITKVLSTF